MARLVQRATTAHPKRYDQAAQQDQGGAVSSVILKADAQLRCSTADFLTRFRKALQKHHAFELTEATFETAWRSLHSDGLFNSDYAEAEPQRRPQFLAGIIDLHLQPDSRRFLAGLRKSNWKLDAPRALLVFGLAGLCNWRFLSTLGALAKHQPDFPTAVRLLEEKRARRQEGLVKLKGLSRAVEWATHDAECATRDLCPQPDTCGYGCAAVQKRGRTKQQPKKPKETKQTKQTKKQKLPGNVDTSNSSQESPADKDNDTDGGEEHADDGQSGLGGVGAEQDDNSLEEDHADEDNVDMNSVHEHHVDKGPLDEDDTDESSVDEHHVHEDTQHEETLDEDSLDEDTDMSASPERECGRRHVSELPDDSTTWLHSNAGCNGDSTLSPASRPSFVDSDLSTSNNIDLDDSDHSTPALALAPAPAPTLPQDDDLIGSCHMPHSVDDGDNNTPAPTARRNETINTAADSTIDTITANSSNIDTTATTSSVNKSSAAVATVATVAAAMSQPPLKRRRTSAIDMPAWHADSLDGWLELFRDPSHDDEKTLDPLPLLHDLCTLNAGVRGTFACFSHDTAEDTSSRPYFTLLNLKSTTIYTTRVAAVPEAVRFAAKYFPNLTFDEDKYTPLLSLANDEDETFMNTFWAAEAAVGRDLSETVDVLPLWKAVIRAGSEYLISRTKSDDIMRWLADELDIIAHSETAAQRMEASTVDLSALHPSLRVLFDGPLECAYRLTQALGSKPHLHECIRSAKHIRTLLDLRARGDQEAPFQQLVQQLVADMQAPQGNKRAKAKRTLDKYKATASERRHALERLCQVIANAVVEWEGELEGIAEVVALQKNTLRDAFAASATNAEDKNHAV